MQKNVPFGQLYPSHLRMRYQYPQFVDGSDPVNLVMRWYHVEYKMIITIRYRNRRDLQSFVRSDCIIINSKIYVSTSRITKTLHNLPFHHSSNDKSWYHMKCWSGRLRNSPCRRPSGRLSTRRRPGMTFLQARLLLTFRWVSMTHILVRYQCQNV